MTMPRPRPRDPLAPLPPVLLPPSRRSRTALGLTVAAAHGRFALQVCGACETVAYPPREVCGACLSPELAWRDVPDGGTVLATTTIRATADPYARSRAPWRTGLVRLDAGATVVAHLHPTAESAGRVRLRLMLDRAGQGVMMALPAEEPPDMTDDPLWREMTCDPRDRRVLVSDARTPLGRAVVMALQRGGAHVFAGVAEAWRPFENVPDAEIVALDVTDESSVRELAASIGGRVEIVVNTGFSMRPDGPASVAREAMEISYFGLSRLADAFGPALAARGAEGTHPACAWVNVLSVHALAALPGWAAASAAQAAALSLSHSLRAHLRPGAIRVVDALVGPLDDEWHAALPPPKVTPQAAAAAIVAALRDGVEEIAVGDVARDIVARWRDDAAILQREMEVPT